MTKRIASLLFGALMALGAGCTSQFASLEQPTCVELFADLDRAQRIFGFDALKLGADGFSNPEPALSRPIRMLRNEGCVTRVNDLAGLGQAAASLQPFERATGGPALPRQQSVHVGVLDGFSTVAMANQYFLGLGYRTRNVGLAGLGRRYYIGPFTGEAEVAQALEAARAGGFAYAYATEFPRF